MTKVMKEMTHCVTLSAAGRMARKMSCCCRGSSLCVCVWGGESVSQLVYFAVHHFILTRIKHVLIAHVNRTSHYCTRQKTHTHTLSLSLSLALNPLLPPYPFRKLYIVYLFYLQPMPLARLIISGATPSPTVLQTVSFPSLPICSRTS